MIYRCVPLQLFLGMPDLVTCRVVCWTFVLLRTISTSAYVHPIPSKQNIRQPIPHRSSGSQASSLSPMCGYRHGLSSLSPWHLCACLDPTASWFRLWCLRLPPPQLLGLLQDTGKRAQSINPYRNDAQQHLDSHRIFCPSLVPNPRPSSEALLIPPLMCAGLLPDLLHRATHGPSFPTPADTPAPASLPSYLPPKSSTLSIPSSLLSLYCRTHALAMLAHLATTLPPLSRCAPPSSCAFLPSTQLPPVPDGIKLETIQASNMLHYHLKTPLPR